ncbi:MAG: glutathione S-transferase N-terminal domain-containing protein [Alphaproteobacteria bacterium]
MQALDLEIAVTPTSPYATIVRLAACLKEIEKDIAWFWTKTRIPNDPMLQYHPSGRIPFARFTDGSVVEETSLIVSYLDSLAKPQLVFAPDPKNPSQRYEATARAMMDGLAVWAREVIRPKDEQSPGIIRHEVERATRLCQYFEQHVHEDSFHGDVNLLQLYLFASLRIDQRLPEFQWRASHPKLLQWWNAFVKQDFVVRTENMKPQ